jgi:uncharacterized phage protein (TIGR02218 family)
MVVTTSGFTAGVNNGTFTVAAVGTLTMDVEGTPLTSESGTGDESILASDGITLFLPMPFPIEVGDTLGLYAGCNKLISTCTAKFANWHNFRGEPYIPGPDALYSIKTRTGQVNEGGKG